MRSSEGAACGGSSRSVGRLNARDRGPEGGRIIELAARSRVAPLAIACLAALTPALGACTDEKPQAKAITIATSAQPDALDPALSYTVGGWQAMWLVYTPLLTYEHAEGTRGTRLIPGLARALPRISDRGRLYQLRLREGLRYSNGRAVRASDFEHTIKRVFQLNSPGARFFVPIVGAERYLKAKRQGADIEGISADDASGSIAIRLVEPQATFSNALATNFAGLVPATSPFKNLTRSPPPGVGPYRLTGSVPNREFVLVQTPGFALPGVPRARIERIVTRIVPDTARQAREVIRNRLDFMQDPAPADLLREARSRYRERFKEFRMLTSASFFLNVAKAPFRKLRVRRAVNLGVDRRAVARIFGGLIEPSCNYLPPAIVGFRRLDPCPHGDPAGRPDLRAARRLVEQAGERGTRVTVWGTTQEPGNKLAVYYADSLSAIGLRPELKLVDFAVYPQVIGKPSTGADTGFNFFAPDFPHPASFLSPLSGDAITREGNVNFGQVDDPELTRAIERLEREPDLRKAASGWAQVERDLIERAYLVPLGQLKGTTFMSERMDFRNCNRVHPLYFHDYTSFCLR